MNQLPEQTATERLAVYRHLTKACQHLYSKGKMQNEKMAAALQEFSPLTKNDPVFLAHLAAWAASEKNQSRDLHLLALYLNALNDGDGTLFMVGGTLRKPNYRLVTQALLNTLKPHQFTRLLYFNKLKWNLHGIEATHFPRCLRTAMKVYLDSLSPATVKKHVGKQFRRHLIEAFRRLRLQPRPKVAQELSWKQQGKRGITIQKDAFVNPFEGLQDEAIAALILSERMSFRRALSFLSPEPSLPIMASLLEAASPNELIIQVAMFEKSGLLAVRELAEKFYAKTKNATSIDRIDAISAPIAEHVKEGMQKARTTARQQQMGLLSGSMFLDVDKSSSMTGAIELAIKSAATLCDVVGANNFSCGVFGTNGKVFSDKPVSKEHAMKIFYGIAATDGQTDCFANYRAVMKDRPVNYYVWITDGGHNYGSTALQGLHKPDMAMIVYVGNRSTELESKLRTNGIPYSLLPVDSLQSSNLVVQAIKTALLGETAIIEEIMNTPLPIKVE